MSQHTILYLGSIFAECLLSKATREICLINRFMMGLFLLFLFLLEKFFLEGTITHNRIHCHVLDWERTNTLVDKDIHGFVFGLTEFFSRWDHEFGFAWLEVMGFHFIGAYYNLLMSIPSFIYSVWVNRMVYGLLRKIRRNNFHNICCVFKCYPERFFFIKSIFIWYLSLCISHM